MGLRPLIAALSLLMLAPAAQGQQSAALITGVIWVEQPGVQDFQRNYPAVASSRGVEGRAVLECLIGSDGRLACSVVSEDPAGYGFGEASLRVAQSFRAGPQTRQGEPTSGRRVRLPIAWRFS